jgi:hypothetical protein
MRYGIEHGAANLVGVIQHAWSDLREHVRGTGPTENPNGHGYNAEKATNAEGFVYGYDFSRTIRHRRLSGRHYAMSNVT